MAGEMNQGRAPSGGRQDRPGGGRDRAAGSSRIDRFPAESTRGGTAGERTAGGIDPGGIDQVRASQSDRSGGGRPEELDGRGRAGSTGAAAAGRRSSTDTGQKRPLVRGQDG
jgi:hypothetical protein